MSQASLWKTCCSVDVREKKQRWMKRKRKTKKVEGVGGDRGVEWRKGSSVGC
jgi:hypothetical protein